MFRFTLRELFLLILTVAIVLGWWVDHRRMANLCDDQKMEIHRLGSLMTPQVR
ncbi:MAG TPA: hypothetical protein VGJ04_01320 [Pirellulales bacterium]|jgi:hypothetical protein